VRVLRIRYGPVEKSVIHGHPRMVAVFLTDAHFRFRYPDGSAEDIRAQAGQVLHFDASEHLVENLSAAPFEAIAVELKG
jgi:hypothetical protein